jgi:hypothetical protein
MQAAVVDTMIRVVKKEETETRPLSLFYTQ